MKKGLFLGVALTLMFITSACAKNTAGDAIQAQNFWARSAAQGGNSAAYMTLKNRTTAEAALVGADSAVADATEIHLSQMKAGVMQMMRQDTVALPAGGKLELKPGSYHVMLIGLKQDLKAGDTFELTLHFADGSSLALRVPVKDAGEMGSSGMDGHMP